MGAERNVLPSKAQRLVVLTELGLGCCLGSFVLFATRSITPHVMTVGYSGGEENRSVTQAFAAADHRWQPAASDRGRGNAQPAAYAGASRLVVFKGESSAASRSCQVRWRNVSSKVCGAI